MRWAKGEYKISFEREMKILVVCLRRVRAAHALVRAMYRRAIPLSALGRSSPRFPVTSL